MPIPDGLTGYSVRRSVVVYRARFTEPAFELLGNPAPLYSQLLRHLGRFGATIRCLSIDVSTLAEAKVTCDISDALAATVAVWGVEAVASLGTVELPEAMEFAAASLRAVAATAPNLTYTSQTVANSLWGSADPLTFSQVAEKLVQSPSGSGFDGLAASVVAWRDALGSTEFRLEEAVDKRGSVFVYSSATFRPSDDLESMSVVFKRQLADRLAAVGLYSEQFS